MSSFSYTISVQSTFGALWALVSDVRRVAGLFPFTAVDDFHDAAPGRWLFRRRVTIPNVANLCWQELSWAEREGELRFQAVAGDLQTFTGQWLVAPDGAGMQLTLPVDYDIPAALRPRVPGAMVEYVMSEMFKSICGRVKETAEGDTR